MNEPIAGKFLLEILTKGMYSNPMHIYREYIQNASDSIAKAIAEGVILPAEIVRLLFEITVLEYLRI